MKVCPSCQLRYPDDSTFCFVEGQTLQPLSDTVLGTTLGGRFRVEQQLGETPWAQTYRARQRLLTEPCIVKIFREPLGELDRTRFSDAIALARRCSHPNIALLEAGGLTGDGRGYLVQPAIDAPALEQLLGRPLPLGQSTAIACQILRALGRMHDFGAVHGSLRPSNVLVLRSGQVVLVDVGLGRSFAREPWEEEPSSLAAQMYLAPELSSQGRASVLADLYALGVTFHRMVTGRFPVEAADVRELRGRLHDEATAGPNGSALAQLPAGVAAWLQGLLARTPDGRPANAHEALDQLAAAAAEAKLALPAPAPHANGAPPMQLDPAFDRWMRYRGLFDKMVTLGFPSGPPPPTRSALESIHGKVDTLVEIGKKALYEHGNVHDIHGRAREGRQRIAEQMNEINEQAKVVRRDLSPLRLAAERHAEKAHAFGPQAVELHREVLRWEGRSGFQEPYKELADAYRGMGDLIEKWWGVTSAQRACEQEAEQKEEQLAELQNQLDELRQALRIHEANLASEIDACERALRELGEHADRLEPELLGLATRFSAPLRSKPELGPCFRELLQI